MHSLNAIQRIFVISLNYLPCQDESANVSMKNLWININQYTNCNKMEIKCKLKRIKSLTMTILNNLFITKRSNSHIEWTYKYCVQRTTKIFMHFLSNIRWHELYECVALGHSILGPVRLFSCMASALLYTTHTFVHPLLPSPFNYNPWTDKSS